MDEVDDGKAVKTRTESKGKKESKRESEGEVPESVLIEREKTAQEREKTLQAQAKIKQDAIDLLKSGKIDLDTFKRLIG